MIEWTCSNCGVTVSFSNEGARGLAIQAGGCQGCRARTTFNKKRGLLGLFLEFWERTSYPTSSSWTEAVEVTA